MTTQALHDIINILHNVICCSERAASPFQTFAPVVAKNVVQPVKKLPTKPLKNVCKAFSPVTSLRF